MCLRPLTILCLLLPSLVHGQELNVKAFKPAWNLMWEEDWVTAVTFVAPNRIVAGNEKGGLLVWELPTDLKAEAPLPVRMLQGHTNGITQLLTAPDGKTVLSASKDHSIRVWDLSASAGQSGEVIIDQKKREIVAKKNTSKPPKITPPIKVQVQTASRVLEDHKEWILGLALSSDGKTLLSGDDNGNVAVWDFPSGKVLRRWQVKGWVHGLAVSPDARWAVVTEQVPLIFDSGRHQAFKIWDVSKGEMVKDLTSVVKENLSSAVFSPDGKKFAVARSGETSQAKIYLFETAGFKKLLEMPGHQGGANDLAFSADGKILLSCGRDTTVRLWNVADGKMLAELGKPRGGQFKDIFHALALSPDQRWIAAADMAGQVQLWYADGGKK